MRIIAALRRWIRRHSRIRAILSVPWTRALHLKWIIRNVIRGYAPFQISSGSDNIDLYPRGQIAEYLWLRDFEAPERDFVRCYLRPGMGVVDAGANIGIYSLIASIRVGERGQVHAFEPSSDTFELLLKNLSLNQASNIQANRMALSAICGRLVLCSDTHRPDWDAHRFIRPDNPTSAPTDQSSELVPCISLDEYMNRVKAPPVHFIKLDVEGYELEVLKGAIGVLSRSPDLVILLECTQHATEVEGLLRRLGYQFWRWDVGLSELVPAPFDEITRQNIIVRRNGWRAIRDG